MILAPLRGVTIRCFREVFAEAIRDGGFTEAMTPFITANAGVDPMKNAELRTKNCGIGRSCASLGFDGTPGEARETTASAIPNSKSPIQNLTITPQFIGKDPAALRRCLERVKAAGYETADLNCGCPYPMVRNKGRGSGLLRTPDVLERMLAVGCEVMGEGRFSAKARLGIDRNDELLSLMPMFNSFPLRFLTVHPRNARQMYDGACDWDAFDRVAEVSKIPLVRNGDIAFPPRGEGDGLVMIGRSFVRHLGGRGDIDGLLRAYIEASCRELCGDNAVLGRMKELISYWREIPRWRRLWSVVKMTRSVDELKSACFG